ncbi:MAG: GNAT family N-acetyltransferase, partial [Alphaproteobacteria bacterium]
MDPVIEIIAVTAPDDGILEMVGKLDAMMKELYPPESTHLTPPEELSTGANRLFAVKVDGKLTGCGGFRVVDRDYAEIKRIYVDPSARGLGLAKALLNRLESESRSLGLLEMKLETGNLQPEAIGLFERCGYAQCPAFGDYPRNDSYSYFMRKS